MEKALLKIFEVAAKLAPFPTAIIFVTSLVILFFPDTLSNEIGLSEFKKNHILTIALSLIITGSYWFVFILSKLKIPFTNIYNAHKEKKYFTKVIVELTPEERGYLRNYIIDKKTTEHFLLNDGISIGLLQKRIILDMSELQRIFRPCNLHPTARRILIKKPSYLDDYVEMKKLGKDAWMSV